LSARLIGNSQFREFIAGEAGGAPSEKGRRGVSPREMDVNRAKMNATGGRVYYISFY
jgi:hypothetical protein